ncbi:MAG: hypothetical protein KatS3mg111_0362 [Pirellulaceae bacterium]|nr:MAG: hypothetical protein KatS3mg111_0362 [Pirellulaceae bacterium]
MLHRLLLQLPRYQHHAHLANRWYVIFGSPTQSFQLPATTRGNQLTGAGASHREGPEAVFYAIRLPIVTAMLKPRFYQTPAPCPAPLSEPMLPPKDNYYQSFGHPTVIMAWYLPLPTLWNGPETHRGVARGS